MNVRISKSQKIQVLNSEDLSGVMQQILLRQNKIRRKKEYFWIAGLELDNTLNFIELVAMGGLNRVHAVPREIFRIAVIKNVPKVILVHNHTTDGKITPSESDKNFTKKLKEGGELIGIEVIDHLIINESEYFSFSDTKVL